MEDALPQLPQAPPVRRRLVVPREHAIGQAVIVLIVVLALVGVFGDGHGVSRTGTQRLTVSVEYPTLMRYKTLGRMDVTIRAASGPIEDLWLLVPAAHLDGFSNVSFQPEPAFATGEVTAIPVGRLGAGEERLVQGELQAERYWLHEGDLEVRAGEESLARVRLSTWVLP